MEKFKPGDKIIPLLRILTGDQTKEVVEVLPELDGVNLVVKSAGRYFFANSKNYSLKKEVFEIGKRYNYSGWVGNNSVYVSDINTNFAIGFDFVGNPWHTSVDNREFYTEA